MARNTNKATGNKATENKAVEATENKAVELTALQVIEGNVTEMLAATGATAGLKAQRYIKTLIGVKRQAKTDGDKATLEKLIVDLQNYRNKAALAAAGKVRSAWFAADYRKDTAHGVATYAPLK